MVAVVDNSSGAVTIVKTQAINTPAINAEVDTALADYDAPTNAEMEARTLAAASYATAAALATTDAVADAIKDKTDSLTFSVSGKVDANITHVNELAIDGAGTEASPFGPT